MRDSPDPSLHRQRQQQVVAHVQKLLEDERFTVDTNAGRKPVTGLFRDVAPGDNAIAVKQKMIELGLFDRELQRKMPSGATLDITLSTKTLFGGKQAAGRVKVITLSPNDSLLTGQPARQITRDEVSKALSSLPPPLGGLPQTVVVVSTSGFEDGALALAERRPSGAAILLGVNDAGGWSAYAPESHYDIARLLDPETIADKKQRVLQEIETGADLFTGGLSAEKIAQQLHLPRALVEEVFREHTGKNPGLATGTFDGKLVLYRAGSGVPGDLTGENMPFWEKIKGIFGRGEEPREKTIAKLSQEKALLGQQRDGAYAEIEKIEKRESELTKQFPEATPLVQKRIATEISQLRKQIERSHQRVAVIDKQMNVVEAGLHNLEMKGHVTKEKIERLEKVSVASEEVDEGLAALEQLSEQADAASIVGLEMNSGAADVLAELQAKFAEKPAAAVQPGERTTTGPVKTPAQPERATNAPPPIPAERRKIPGAAEPG